MYFKDPFVVILGMVCDWVYHNMANPVAKYCGLWSILVRTHVLVFVSLLLKMEFTNFDQMATGLSKKKTWQTMANWCNQFEI